MIKETIILNMPEAPRSWTFPLELDGLTPKLDQNGAVLLEDEAGEVQAVIPTAWMEDSSKNPETGGPAVSTDVSYQLHKQDGGWALQVTMGDAWLDDPARQYPVYVDPSVDVESSGDAFVQDTWPDGNFSGDDELKVGSYDGGGQRAYSCLKFSDIDSQLNNRYILNAGLGLFNVWSSSCSRGLPESVVEPATTAHPDPADRTWTTVYNAENQPVDRRLPGGVTQTTTYDALGRVTERAGTGAEAATTTGTFGYDMAGRVTSVSAPGGDNTYTWDDRGNLLSANGPSGTAAFAYDAMSRMTRRTDAAGTTTFGYDAAGRLDTAVDPLTGATLDYGYDGASRLTSVGYGSGGAQRTLVRDAFGRITSDTLTAPDGTETTSVTYGYDDAGQLVSKTTSGTAGAGENTYTYDRAGRMTGWTAPDGTVTAYEWDAAGNRVRSGEVTATYDARNRLLTAGEESYSWSARGTLRSVTPTADGTRTLEFDAYGRMVSDDGTAYAYDALNRLVQRGSTRLSYANLTNNPVAAGGQVLARTPGGTPLSSAATDGTGAVALGRNTHTDVTSSFDPATGALSGSSAYSPFGKVTDRQGTGTGLGYQGGWTDPDSGKVNMHARWYDPALGTFASRDSWTLNPVPSIQANRYTYGNGTPLTASDPTGHAAIVLGGVAIGAAAEALGLATVIVAGGSWLVSQDWGLPNWFDWSSGGSTSSDSYSTSWAGSHSSTQAAIEAQAWAATRAAAMEAARQAAYDNWWDQAHGGNNGGGGSYGGGSYGGGGGGGGSVGPVVRPGGGPGFPGFGPPPPPPPPDWPKILKEVLSKEVARTATKAVVDSLHKLFVADSATDSRQELEEVTPEELRGYFKLFPRAQGEEMAETLLGLAPEPGSDGGSGTSSDDNPCSKGREARYNYQPLRDGRPDGATALICPDDLKPRGAKRDDSGSVNVHGFPTSGNVDENGKPICNRTHIVADQFHGAWISENLFTGHDRMNKIGMKRCENKIAKQLRQDNPVFYSGQLIYGGAGDGKPDAIRMTAYTRNGLLFDKTVKNISDWQTTC